MVERERNVPSVFEELHQGVDRDLQDFGRTRRTRHRVARQPRQRPEFADGRDRRQQKTRRLAIDQGHLAIDEKLQVRRSRPRLKQNLVRSEPNALERPNELAEVVI